MKLFYDLFPLLLFFIAYKFFGIYVATGVAIVASVLQVSWSLIRKRVEIMQIVTCVIILVFGTLTIALHNPIFVKWKPSIINFIFAAIFFGGQYVGEKNMLQRILGSKITMRKDAWKKLNYMWLQFFLFVAIANLIVVYTCSTETWVNFKVFGILGITLVFVFWQAYFMSKNGDMIEETKKGENKC